MNKWWAYIHENGTLHVKRYWDMTDLEEAMYSPFVKHMFGPFDAQNKDDAKLIAHRYFAKMKVA